MIIQTLVIYAAGVTFSSVSLNRKLKEIKFFKDRIPNLISYLDLVALGTIYDLVNLITLIKLFKQGIKALNLYLILEFHQL